MTHHDTTLGQPEGVAIGTLERRAPEIEVGRIPSIAVEAFYDSPDVCSKIERAAADRRFARATLSTHSGGVAAAIERYRGLPTPSLIILETEAQPDLLFAQLDELATVCDVTTKLIVVGRSNDIDLYRALVSRGVSEYLRAPLDPARMITSIAEIFSNPAAGKLGRMYAFVGARGGSGSSTLAHNVGWTLGRFSGGDVIIADMDLAFGTAALDYDLKPEASIANAIAEPERLDSQMLERLLAPCGDHLSVLAAPARLDVSGSLDPGAVEAVLDVAQATVSHVVVDVPHLWSDWAKRTLIAADEVVITATPDLASLRNAQNLVDLLRSARPNDPEPRLILNQVGVPKRPELKPAEFTEALKVAPLVTIPFDAATFGAAAGSGQMLADIRPGSAYLPKLRMIAETLVGRPLQDGRRGGRLRRLLGLGKPGRSGR